MKKIISIIFLMIALFFGITACSLPGEDSDIVIFTQTGCPHCEHALTYINTVVKNDFPTLTISEFNIRESDENYQLFLKYVKKYLPEEKHIGTPLIISNGKVFMGWNPETQQNFSDHLKQLNQTK